MLTHVAMYPGKEAIYVFPLFLREEKMKILPARKTKGTNRFTSGNITSKTLDLRPFILIVLTIYLIVVFGG